LGVGCSIKKLSVEKLASALMLITGDEKMRERARLLGEQVRSEDGVGKAIECIYRDLEFSKDRIRSLRKKFE
jgi:sterol 3beta-glucosyltransferase